MHRKFFLLTMLVSCTCCFFCTAPQAKAVDPITISLLAPYAIKAYEKAQPYLKRCLINTAKAFVLMGKDTLEIFLLPWGMMEMMFGWPFGYFGNGVKNTVYGGIAPFKLAFHAAMLPLYMFGIMNPY